MRTRDLRERLMDQFFVTDKLLQARWVNFCESVDKQMRAGPFAKAATIYAR